MVDVRVAPEKPKGGSWISRAFFLVLACAHSRLEGPEAVVGNRPAREWHSRTFDPAITEPGRRARNPSRRTSNIESRAGRDGPQGDRRDSHRTTRSEELPSRPQVLRSNPFSFHRCPCRHTRPWSMSRHCRPVPDSRPPRWLNRLALRVSVFPRRPPCVLQPPDRDCVAG